MIIEKRGDIFYQKCDVIIHQANCFATMGAGIAAQIRMRYPGALAADKNFGIPVGSKDRLGNFSKYDTYDRLSIYNLYAQYNYGRGLQTNYRSFNNGLSKIFSDIKKSKVTPINIGIPHGIGCGLAGGNWNTIRKIIEDQSRKHDLDIYIYKL